MKSQKALGVLFFTVFLDLLGFGLIIPILPTLAQDLGASESQIGLIAAIYALMNFAFSPFWGTLSDRYGRRPIILTSILITATAYLIFAQAHFLWILILSRVFSGIGSANIGAAQAYIGDVTSPADRAKRMGLIGAAFGLGFIAGPPLGGFVKAEYGLEVMGYLAASFSGINFILAYIFLPESLKDKNREAAFNYNVLKSIRDELRKPMIRELFVVNFIFITAFSMMQVTAVLLWEQYSFYNEQEIGLVFMYIGVCSAIVQATLIGLFKKKFGENRMLVIGVMLLAIGLLAMPFLQDDLFIPWQLVALLLIALANGFIGPSLLSMITQYCEPHEVGRTTGLNQSFGSLGRVIGPIIGGALYEWEHHLPYLVGPAILMIAYSLAIRLKKSAGSEGSVQAEPISSARN
ncbi:MAG: MFS transporter [Bacteroidetes bacterium]|nr:MFS transporter [Bacteroidota bacterium]